MKPRLVRKFWLDNSTCSIPGKSGEIISGNFNQKVIFRSKSNFDSFWRFCFKFCISARIFNITVDSSPPLVSRSCLLQGRLLAWAQFTKETWRNLGVPKLTWKILVLERFVERAELYKQGTKMKRFDPPQGCNNDLQTGSLKASARFSVSREEIIENKEKPLEFRIISAETKLFSHYFWNHLL